MENVSVQNQTGGFRVDSIGGGQLVKKLYESPLKNTPAEVNLMDLRYLSSIGGAAFLAAAILGVLMSALSLPLAAKLMLPMGSMVRIGDGVEIGGSLLAAAISAYVNRKQKE